MIKTQPSAAIIVAFEPSPWVPTTPFSVSHTVFGLYGSFETFNGAMFYANEIAALMQCPIEIEVPENV